MTSRPQLESPQVGVGAAAHRRWFVAEIHSRKECVAQINLRRQAFETFYPKFLKSRRRAARIEDVPVPLFPRYIFIAATGADVRWRSVNATIGVKRLLSSGGDRPAVMPDAVMQEIFARCDGENVLRLSEDMMPGQTVRVVNGPLGQSLATLESLDGRGRVRVLLNFLGSATVVTLGMDSIEAVND